MADQQPTLQTPQGKKKLKSSTVKDAISKKGRTITGDKPDQIDINPVQEKTINIDDAFDFFFFAESVNTAGSGSVRGMGYVSGNVGVDRDSNNSTYTNGNVSDASQNTTSIEQLKQAMHDSLHTDVNASSSINASIDADTKDNVLKPTKSNRIKESVNDENPDPEEREAVSRSKQDSKLKMLVPRGKGDDRKNCDRPYRMQSILKKIIDEDTTTSDIPVWEKPGPKGKSEKMTPGQILRAKARARRAGRPYPNLVDNMAVKKDENV